jgi:hypothetical protein
VATTWQVYLYLNPHSKDTELCFIAVRVFFKYLASGVHVCFSFQEMEAKKKQEAEKRLSDKRGGREPTNSAIVAVER